MPSSNSEARKRNEEKPKASCGHRLWRDGYCAEMSCSNYVNKHMGISHLPGDDEVEGP